MSAGVIETLTDWNRALACCCSMPGFITPVLEGKHFYLVQSPCYEKTLLFGGTTYYYRKYEYSLEISHTSYGVNTSYSKFTRDGKTWNPATLACDIDTPIDTESGGVTCPVAKTTVDSTVGTPPADYIDRRVQSAGPTVDPTHNYLSTRELRYIDAYDWPIDLRNEADDVVADKIANELFNLSGFKATYDWGLSAVALRTGRFRWDLTSHTGSWFKITWDIAFYPDGGGTAVPFLQDQTYEWTGAVGGPPPGSEDLWKSPWFVVEGPPEKGEYKIVNIRFSGYRTPYGIPIQTTGVSEDYA